MKRQLIFIVGRSGSGKDTTADYLCRAYGYRKIASYTTRPMRNGEMQGVEHTFVHWGSVAHRPDVWCEHRNMNLLAHTYYGGHYYWTSREQLLFDKLPVTITKRSFKRKVSTMPVVYVIDEKGLTEMLDNTAHLAWLNEKFSIEKWYISRAESSGIDAERTARDDNRMELPSSFYDHIINNCYEIDYLYSVIDAIMKRTE